MSRWVWRWWYFFGRCLNVFSAWGSHDATRPKDMHSRLDVLVLHKGNQVMTTSIAHHMSCRAITASFTVFHLNLVRYWNPIMNLARWCTCGFPELTNLKLWPFPKDSLLWCSKEKPKSVASWEGVANCLPKQVGTGKHAQRSAFHIFHLGV